MPVAHSEFPSLGEEISIASHGRAMLETGRRIGHLDAANYVMDQIREGKSPSLIDVAFALALLSTSEGKV